MNQDDIDCARTDGVLLINSLYAFVATDTESEELEEGVVAVWHPSTGWMPLVAADKEMVDSMRPHAQGVANEHGMNVTLVRFENRTPLETITPKGVVPDVLRMVEHINHEEDLERKEKDDG